MSENKDKNVPRDNEYPQGEVNTPAFDEKVHLFWGPNQPTLYPNYAKPSGWRKENINIPKVVRFIHNSPGLYEADRYKKPTEPDDVPFDLQDRVIFVGEHYIGGLFLVGWDKFLNGNRIYSGYSTGLLRYDRGVDLMQFYYVGLSFRLTYFQRQPITYSIDFSAYFEGYGGTIVTPV